MGCGEVGVEEGVEVVEVVVVDVAAASNVTVAAALRPALRGAAPASHRLRRAVDDAAFGSGVGGT